MQIETYLFFGGNCEEALEFYKRCLGGEIVALVRYEGSGMGPANLPADWKHKVMHAALEAHGARILAADSRPGEPPPRYSGFNVSLFVPGDAQNARQAFEALSEGGQVRLPFAPPPWGGHFGMLTDRFGVPWMVSSEH